MSTKPTEDQKERSAYFDPTPHFSGNRPLCFGLEYEPDDKECQECLEFVKACQEEFLKKYKRPLEVDNTTTSHASPQGEEDKPPFEREQAHGDERLGGHLPSGPTQLTEGEFKELSKPIPISQLKPRQFDIIRELDKCIDQSRLDALTQSIKENGVRDPLKVKEDPSDGKYWVVCGNTRYSIAKAAHLENPDDEKLKNLRCDVLADDFAVPAQEILAIEDNTHRRMLSPMMDHLMIARYKQIVDEMVDPFRKGGGSLLDPPWVNVTPEVEKHLRGMHEEKEAGSSHPLYSYVGKVFGKGKSTVQRADQTAKAFRSLFGISKREANWLEKTMQEVAASGGKITLNGEMVKVLEMSPSKLLEIYEKKKKDEQQGSPGTGSKPAKVTSGSDSNTQSKTQTVKKAKVGEDALELRKFAKPEEHGIQKADATKTTKTDPDKFPKQVGWQMVGAYDSETVLQRAKSAIDKVEGKRSFKYDTVWIIVRWQLNS